MSKHRWWHIYGGEAEGMVVFVMLETALPSAKMPEGWCPDEWFGLTKADLAVGTLPWRASFDHPPTPDEIRALGFEPDEDG